jgi:hypothetical protein
MQMNGSFNANQFEPNQGGGGGHPPAQKVPFRITNTAIKENSAKDGGFFEVEFTSPMGSVIQRYNIWNKTPKAVEIAHGQLSALCRAVNIYQIDWSNEGAALRNAQGLMDVGYQKGEEPSEANPNAKGYTELKKVYDMGGNEPGKAPAQQQPMQAQPQQQPQQQPMTQQPGGGWGQGQAPAIQQPQQAAQQPQQGGWNGAAPQQPQPQQNAGGAWQPGQNGAAPGGSPPWGNRQ